MSKNKANKHTNGKHHGPVTGAAGPAATGPATSDLSLSADEKIKLKGLSDNLKARQAALGEAVYRLMATGGFPLVQQVHEAQAAVEKFATDALRVRGFDANDPVKKFNLDTEALTLTRVV